MRKNNYLCNRKNKLQMLTQFKQYLDSKGITPTKEVEEQITFLLDGLYYLFVYESSDQNYFRIILPNIFKVENDTVKYDSLVNNINQRYKVAKATLTNDGMVWISAEQYVYSREGIEYLFERCIAALRGVVEFIKEQQSKLSHD